MTELKKRLDADLGDIARQQPLMQFEAALSDTIALALSRPDGNTPELDCYTFLDALPQRESQRQDVEGTRSRWRKVPRTDGTCPRSKGDVAPKHARHARKEAIEHEQLPTAPQLDT